MYVKFFSRGYGDGRGPVNYLVGTDGPRPDATVLKGEPEQTRDLIDDLEFSRRYTSAVLSFAEPDISQDLKDQCIREFEQTLLSGLDHDQYDALWVQHQDKGRLELHCVIPNVELLTGKRLQPFYNNADLGRVNQWKTAVNAEHNLADPSDPRRRQSLTIPNDLPRNKYDALEAIKPALEKAVKEGKIKNRDDVIQAFKDANFEVPKVTKSSISIRRENSKKNVRLTGKFFERQFTSPDKITTEDSGAEYDAQRLERAHDARSRWYSMIERKAQYNKGRYPRPPSPTPSPKPEVNHGVTSSERSSQRRKRTAPDTRPEAVTARRTHKHARELIDQARALGIIGQCRTIARKATADRRRHVLHPVRSTGLARQADNLRAIQAAHAAMSGLPKFNGGSRWRDYAVQQPESRAVLHLLGLHRLLKIRANAIENGAQTTLHDDATGWGRSAGYEQTTEAQTFLLKDGPDSSGPEPDESNDMDM